MNIFNNIKKYFNGRFDKKVKESLDRQRSRLQFNPLLLAETEKTVQTPLNFSKRIMEYRVWSMGNARMLRRIYRMQHFDADDAVKLNYFWATAPITRRLCHTGIPGLLSRRMSDILFGGGIDTKVEVFNESGSHDKQKEKSANELLNALVSLCSLQERIGKGATDESWGGHTFFKLSHDLSVSQYPIIEEEDLTKAEVVKVRGITKAIIFKRWYNYNNSEYRLDEIYSTNIQGDATIQYKLYKHEGKESHEVPLLSIPQTAEMFIVGTEGNIDGMHLDENATFTYTGLKGILAFDKPNKPISLEFPDSIYGASDYEGSIDSFDALDEVYSQNFREIRTNETKRYVPETMMPSHLSKDGQEIIYDAFDEYTDCYTKVKGDLDQDADNKIEYQKIDDKTESYMQKWKVALSTICNNAKISPFALGITWLEAVNPSADSQRERNKVTLDMRKSKLKLWQPMLEEMLTRLLQLNSWLQKNTDANQDAFSDVDLTWDNTQVKVDFGEYLEDSTEQRITTWGTAKTQRVASTKECVRSIHTDWSEEEIDEEVNEIRFEDGMSTDTPEGLPDLTGMGTEDGGNTTE